MRKIAILVVFALAAGLLFSACYGDKGTVAAITARGELRVGVKVDVPRFGYINPNTGEIEGLEIDIARALAKKILGDENAVSFLPITALTRENLLNNGEVDLVIANFTITDERAERFNFSEPYYSDMIGFLVRTDSGISEIANIDAKTIGVIRSTTAFNEFSANPDIFGVSFNLKSYASYPELENALLTGEVDVFSADTSILYGYICEETRLLPDAVNPQPYGIATKLNDKDFAKYIDDFLKTMTEDGTLGAILDRWTGNEE